MQNIVTRQIRSLIPRMLDKLGYQVIDRVPEPNPIYLWEKDVHFNHIMQQVARHTLIDTVRCFMIYQLVRQAGNLPGDLAEVGVYKGGTAKLLAKSVDPGTKKLHLFDTFTEMPQVDPSVTSIGGAILEILL